MSFNYPTINGSGLPAMLPLLTNLANGNHFLPSLAANQAVTAGLFTAHNPSASTSLTENILQSKLCQVPGAGPMDLETLSEDCDTHAFIQSPSGSELSLTSSAPNVRKADENAEKSFSTFNACDVMYNMGIPSQNLMMMPGVMNMVRDTSSIVQQLPQFSLLNQLQVQTTPTVSTANLPDANTTLTTVNVTANSTPSVSKETITCKSCVLIPPNPSAPTPSTRERPSGCRTVFEGGLPENITEDIIREIFERCGEITTLRLSKKNFCHICFVFEASVDSAIYLSGYRIRINNLSDSSNCGRLHVDFAQARDDQYDFECKQRQWQREQRHRERVERDRLRPQSPPVVYFSEHEASSIAEKLKQDDTFTKAVQIFITWLERGDCNKKNSNTFYSMIQSTNSHVRRLLSKKTAYEEELNKAKESHRKHMQSLSTEQPVPTILGGPDLFVDKGSTINLTCTIRFGSEPHGPIFWKHEEKEISAESSRGGIDIKRVYGEWTTSYLLIRDANIADSGIYTCAPAGGGQTHIKVHVFLHGERPEAMQTGREVNTRKNIAV